MGTEQLEVSEPSSCEGDVEKKNARPEKAPAVVVFMSKSSLWCTFVFILLSQNWLLVLDRAVLGLTPHAMSHFSQSAHSVVPFLHIIVGVSSGVLRLPMAKFIDEFSRDAGYCTAWGISLLGLLIYTGAQSLTAAIVARIFYGIGSSCLDFVLTIILADMTSLKNRALIYGIYTTPVILATVAGPEFTKEFLSMGNWRGGFGILAGLWFIGAMGFSLILFTEQDRPCDDDQESGATTTQKPRLRDRLRRFAVELDIPGVVLAITGICLILLSPSHASGTREAWSSSSFYVMIALGTLSLLIFTVWERVFAPVTCFPWHLMRDRNLLGGCLVVMFTAASTTFWGPYYNSYLQVVYDRTSTTANRMTYVRVCISSLSAILLGFLLRKTGGYKTPAIFAGPILTIFTGLLLALHGINVPIAALAIFQVFFGFSESLLMSCSQMAVMASVGHEHVALAVGIWGSFISIAVAISSTDATLLWTKVVPRILEDALPRDVATELLGDLEHYAIEYPIGSTIRDAVVAVYWAAQESLFIKGACFAPLAFACIFLWRNIDLRDRDEPQGKRARGVIF